MLKKVTIITPASTGNFGIFFDICGAALTKPSLNVTLERTTQPFFEMETKSAASTPPGRIRGMAGKKALEMYLNSQGIESKGLKLTFTDTDATGYRTGGTGLSGAEAVGAVIAGAILFDTSPSIEEVIFAGAKAEPNEHVDNVAPSAMGGLVFLTQDSAGKIIIDKMKMLKELGCAIGFSSHKKVLGTEGTREVLKTPIKSEIFVRQGGRIARGIMALQEGHMDKFLDAIIEDEYQEPRRADAGLYGNFSAIKFYDIKHELLDSYGVALTVSGAGPNMWFSYNRKKYPKGLTEEPIHAITSWFANHGVTLSVEETGIEEQGAYEFAQQHYPQSALARLSKIS